jgi:hypothetical protein
MKLRRRSLILFRQNVGWGRFDCSLVAAARGAMYEAWSVTSQMNRITKPRRTLPFGSFEVNSFCRRRALGGGDRMPGTQTLLQSAAMLLGFDF